MSDFEETLIILRNIADELRPLRNEIGERANAKINFVRDKLAELSLGIESTVTLRGAEPHLIVHYQKGPEGWDFYVEGGPYTHEWKLLQESKLWIRVEAAEMLPALLGEIEIKASALLERIKEVNSRWRDGS